jgi:gamma-glutamyltranspeptidase/glutathione hydrolase
MAAYAKGGNAVDAALAAAITLAVVEPVSTGLGSDLFATVWDGAALHGLNASGRAPAGWTRERFDGAAAMPQLGWDSATIPGGISGWGELSRRFGRLPYAALFDDAIRYARAGFLVSPVVAYKWAWGVERWAGQPGFAETFLPNGRPPRAGERFVNRPLADSLEKIAASGGESFYRGALAEAMAAHARACGAAHTFDDFAAQQCDWVTPIAQDYRGWTVHEIPPNGQGIAALMALGMLEHFDLASLGPGHPDAWHLPIEAMKLAFADVRAQVGDPAAMRVAPQDMLDPDYLAARAATIRRDRAGSPVAGLAPGGTVYLGTGDAGGRMVSLIQSTFMGFGSGVVVPGTGIHLHNRGSSFSLEDGHPNAVGAGKRPLHTILPAFLSRSGTPVAAFGVMGGPMQPQGHVQLMTRILDHGENPQSALDAPRWKVGAGLTVDIEDGAPTAVLNELAARGHDIGRTDTYADMGAGQVVWRLDDGYLAASDWRRDGGALGR